jgi:hypothetical protein
VLAADADRAGDAGEHERAEQDPDEGARDERQRLPLLGGEVDP